MSELDPLAQELETEMNHYPQAEEEQYTPSVVFDGGRGYIDTGAIRGNSPGDLGPVFRECLLAAGHDPDTVRIGDKLKESHWTQRTAVRQWDASRGVFIRTGEYETVWLHSYKFEAILDDGPDSANDIESIILSAGTRDTSASGDFWYVFQAGDLQLGKRSRDGSTPEIIARFVESVNAAKKELAEYKATIGIAGVQICFPGDCIEGSASQGGKNARLTRESVPEQTRIFRRLMMYAIEHLSDAPQVFVDVVNGNHDENTRQWNERPGDGWATEVAVGVSDALELNPLAFGHVRVRVPDVWSGSMTVPVGDSVVTVIHGHQFRQQHNAFKWLAEQALHRQPAGAAQLVQHGHFHQLYVEQAKAVTRICSPTFDCGSDWYRESHGSESNRGAVTYLLRSGQVSRMGVI